MSSSYEPDRDDPGLAVVTQALERWQSMPPIEITISRWEAFVLVGLLQFAIRGPLDGGPLRIAESIGRQLQEGIADAPEIYNLMELGWSTDHDVTDTPSPNEKS